MTLTDFDNAASKQKAILSLVRCKWRVNLPWLTVGLAAGRNAMDSMRFIEGDRTHLAVKILVYSEKS
jgi:hypothetical protein